MKRFFIVSAILGLVFVTSAQAEYLGKFSVNPGNPDSLKNTTGRSGMQYLSNKYTTGGPRLYNDRGEFRGNLNGNKYDPNSVSNPYGRYGSKYSPDSINNKYSPAGSKYSNESPWNPLGTGLHVVD